MSVKREVMTVHPMPTVTTLSVAMNVLASRIIMATDGSAYVSTFSMLEPFHD